MEPKSAEVSPVTIDDWCDRYQDGGGWSRGAATGLLGSAAILDEKALGDVIGSFREKRSLSLSV